MTISTPANTEQSSQGKDPIKQQWCDAFNRRPITETQAYDIADQFIGSHPKYSDYVVEFLCEYYNRQRHEVLKSIADAGDQSSDFKQTKDAIARLADKAVSKATIADVFPAPLADILERSSDKTNTNPWVEGAAALVATAALIGSRVMIQTKFKSRKPLPGNFNLDICGDSSASKSISTDKVMDALKEVRKDFYLDQQAALEGLNQNNQLDDAKRKEEKQKVINNRQEILMTPDSFSAEALIKDICKQGSRSGVVLHLDEGSNMLQNEQYAGSGSSSGNSSGSTNGLYKQMVLKAQLNPLDGPALQRVDPERGGYYRNQTFSSSANIQMAFLPKIFAFDEDSHGWTSRHVFVEAGPKIKDSGYEILDEEDELYVFMEERLIPFMQSLKPAPIVGPNGKIIDEGFVVLEFDTDAQHIYHEYCKALLTQAESLARDSIEPAWATYLKKGSIRVGKFALLLHLISEIKGAQRTDTVTGEILDEQDYDLESLGFNFNDEKRSTLTFQNALKRIKRPINCETVRRAINLEIFFQSEFQKISDICRAAPAVKQAAIEDGKKYQRCQIVLNKLKEQDLGQAKESDLKKCLKGRQGLTNKEITNCIVLCTELGCIERVKTGQTFQLKYIKPIRY